MWLRPNDVVIVTDIGCSGFFDNFFNTHAMHGLHGRALTYASGIKLANPRLKVIVVMGDGGLGIGGALSCPGYGELDRDSFATAYYRWGWVMDQPQIFPLVRQEVRTLLNAYIRAPRIMEHIEEYIVPPGLGGRAGVLGAVALAQRALGQS